jgi:cytochrome c nitrite reductase small subunit
MAPSGPRGPARVADLHLSWWLLALAVALGVFAGVGMYTFGYAKGASYLSTDPKACVNCHIMQPQYDAWQKSSHHAVAVCVDCHLPQSFFAKWYTKSENGYRHGKLFTTQNFHEPIHVQAAGQAVLQENCVRCHGSMVADMLSAVRTGLEGAHGGSEVRCVQCHASVAHGDRAGLGGPLTKEEARADPASHVKEKL